MADGVVEGWTEGRAEVRTWPQAGQRAANRAMWRECRGQVTVEGNGKD